MKEKHLLLLLVLSLISFSCKKEYSKSVNQNNIAQSIYIIYDEYFDTTSATISFHQNNANGNELFLSGGASVTINGQTPIPTIYPVYNVKWKGVVDSVTFVYTDTHGDIYTNTIFLHTADFPIGFNDTIDSNIDVVLNWVGNPNSILGQSTSLQVQEDIEIALCGGPNGNYCTYGGSTQSGDTTATIFSTAPGIYNVGMTRKVLSWALHQSTNAGGVYRSWYKTRSRQVTVQ